jgi:hypothetical protein
MTLAEFDRPALINNPMLMKAFWPGCAEGVKPHLLEIKY